MGNIIGNNIKTLREGKGETDMCYATKTTDMCYATKTSEVCAIIQLFVDWQKSLKETIEYILSKYDGITEAYITEKYNSFSSNK